MQASPIPSASAAQRAQACLHALAGFGLVSLMSMAAMAGMAQAQTQAQGRRAASAPKPVCLVADFRSLALETHDPQQRANASREWLRANGSACTAAQLGSIASNRAAWLGNADSPALMGMIDGMIETRETKVVVINSVSAAAPAANQTANQTTMTGTPPPKIVPPANTAGAVPVVVPVAVPVPTPKS